MMYRGRSLCDIEIQLRKESTKELLRYWHTVDEGFAGESAYFIHKELLRRGFHHVRVDGYGMLIPPYFVQVDPEDV